MKNLTFNRSVYQLILFLVFTAGLNLFTSAGAEEKDDLLANSEEFYSIIPHGAEPELVFDGTVTEPGLTFTEGPSWMNGKLYFSNYYMFWKKWRSSDEGGLIVINADGSHSVLNKNVQTCGTIPMDNGNLAVCDLINCSIIEMSPDGTVVRTLAGSYNGLRFGRPNDLVIDAKGGIYFTDPNNGPKWKEKQPGNAIFYLTPKKELVKLTDWDEFGFPNGCLLSPDGGTFYVNESQSVNVWMYDVNEDGTLANKRIFTELLMPPGSMKGRRPRSNADGMTIDTFGNIYVALPHGVEIFDSAGKYIGIIRFPQSASNCIFGGENMKTLYATCRDRIYKINTNVTGLAYPPKKVSDKERKRIR